MDIQEYKITNKETGESHFAIPHIIGNETVTFKLQDTGEEIIFSNIGSVGDLQHELFTAEISDKSFAEVQKELNPITDMLGVEQEVTGTEEVEAQIEATAEVQSTETETAEAEEVTE